MNWITNYVRPKINSMLGRREVPENLWIKCPETGEMVFHKDLEDNFQVVPASGYHMKMAARARLAHMFDGGQYQTLPSPKVPQDPLKFRDSKKYADRLKEYRVKTGLDDTILSGYGQMRGVPVEVRARGRGGHGAVPRVAGGVRVSDGGGRAEFDGVSGLPHH